MSRSHMTVRLGTSDDLDSLVDLGLEAMPMDPQWEYRYPHRFEYPDEHRICTRRRDWNPRHVEAFPRAVRAASDEKFDSRYGEKQVHLQILGTHPDYQRRGAASTLLRYGIQQAREEKLPITLLASPMGQPLYATFGFEDRGKVFVQLDGEEDKVTLDAMALEVAK
ncbi:unnamed protein product [Clonostachys rhizophaga]|uniref:N-acetyltransferase domain-containing protein n=1 Tax=Clonostachys rhizophaga TaxID=160324 RepID=A0A9N9YWI7_9HYPO|nr:unnamed protein product [Clonostachys rhizophaga]